jgi:biopolymer transport protein ExbD
MQTIIKACLVALVAMCVANAQIATKPALRSGISVKMPVARHAVEAPAADQQNATLVGVTADGRVFVGTTQVETSALTSLTEGTVYVKADARVPYQKVLTVLDALHGRPVVLLTAPGSNVERENIVPPYGVKVTLGGR